MTENIKIQLSASLAQKILTNKSNATAYLLRLNQKKKINSVTFKTVQRGKNKGEVLPDIKGKDIWQLIADSWDYEISKDIIRDMFKDTPKYKNGKKANVIMDSLIKEWGTLKLGSIEWPFSQNDFDGFVQRVNSENIDGFLKDEKVKNAAIKFRRIKEINTVRNDYIETLIFEKNPNILPTLNHRRGIDFFIDGISYDQKVAKSPTKQFKDKFKNLWRQQAINNPQLVARYLYEYQDEGRFGADPRLLVVYIDEDISIDRIKEIINTTNLAKPTEINFSFKHKIQGEINYTVPCFVILLYK